MYILRIAALWNDGSRATNDLTNSCSGVSFTSPFFAATGVVIVDRATAEPLAATGGGADATTLRVVSDATDLGLDAMTVAGVMIVFVVVVVVAVERIGGILTSKSVVDVVCRKLDKIVLP